VTVSGWVEAIAAVPAVVWVTVTGVCLLAVALTSWATRRTMRRASRRSAASAAGVEHPGSGVWLTLATLVPAVFFFVMVLAGSFHGLVGFGYFTLGWRGGWQLLVPATLDGVSLAFAMLAFRAVRNGRSPDRSRRVVLVAAAASATINYGYEYGTAGTVLAGGYVGLLSLFAMFLFDELLAQFETQQQTLRRDNPKFGLRWLTWPSNTFCAAVAWRNHPPVDGTPGTVRSAMENLERVRAGKHAARIRRHHSGSATAVVPGPPGQARTAVASGFSDPLPRADDDGLAARPVRLVPARGSGHTVGRGGRPDRGEVRVPTTAATVRQWAALWLAMCADPVLASGPLTDDEVALSRFGVKARQLRNVRYAASTGALRRRAAELDVALPPDYVDTPMRALPAETPTPD
jgi:Protein of unknown function (DUF2637)